MLKRLQCVLVVFCSIILHTRAQMLRDLNDMFTTNLPSTTEEDSEELTETIVDLDALMDLDGGYGKYSTQSFEYVNWQHYYEDDQFFYEKDKDHVALIQQRCSADFVKCVSNLEIPGPVCGMFYRGYHPYYRYKTFRSYCHVYLENCLFYHRRYRMISFGYCTFSDDPSPDTRWEYSSEEKVKTKKPIPQL